MAFKVVYWVHNDKQGYMVLRWVNCVHIDKIRSNGLERGQLVHNPKIKQNGQFRLNQKFLLKSVVHQNVQFQAILPKSLHFLPNTHFFQNKKWQIHGFKTRKTICHCNTLTETWKYTFSSKKK